jgi:hypothetical protein
MKRRIKKLIDEHFIHPLATAITNRLEGGQKQIMDELDKLKTKIDELQDAVHASRGRADDVVTRLDALKKSIDDHPNAGGDPRIAALSTEVDGIVADVRLIAPAPPVATTTDAGSGSAPSSDPQP